MAKPNLHPTYCPWCRNNTDTFVDLKTEDRVYKCGHCKNHFTGPVWPGNCPICSAPSGMQTYITTLGAGDRVPGDPCSECQAKQTTMDEAVKAGGVRFQCTGCGMDGVFSSATPFAQKVRDDLKTPPPEDVRIQIKTCPNCDVPKEADPVDALKEHAESIGTDQLLADAIAEGIEAETVNLLDDNTAFAKEWDAAVDGITKAPTDLDALANEIESL